MKINSYLKIASITGLANSMGSALLALIFLPLIIGTIGVRDYGILALLVIFVGISSTADLGLSKAIVYYLPKQQNQRTIDEIFSSVLFLNSIMVAVVLLIGGVFVLNNFNPWNNKDVDASLSQLLIFCGSIIVVSLVVTSTFRALLESVYKIYLVNLGYLLLTALNYVLVYLVASFTTNIRTLLLVSTAIYVFVTLYFIIAAKLTTEVTLVMPRVETMKLVLKYSSGIFTIGLINTLIIPINRYIVVSLSPNITSYSYFDLGLKIALIATGCLTAFASPLLSLFSKLGQQELGFIKRLLSRYTLGLGTLYIAGCILFSFVGKLLITELVHTPSNELFHISLILLGGFCFSGVAEPFNCAHLALGNLGNLVKLRVLVPILNILIFFSLHLPPLLAVVISISFSHAIVSILMVLSFYYTYSYRTQLPRL